MIKICLIRIVALVHKSFWHGLMLKDKAGFDVKILITSVMQLDAVFNQVQLALSFNLIVHIFADVLKVQSCPT